MDGTLQLALMQKIRSTFESDRLLVAFPLVPASFSVASLAAINVGAGSAEQLNSVAGWSRLVNLVPSGDVLLEVNRPLLWDVMDGLFRSLIPPVIATGQLSAADKQRLSKAEATLYLTVNNTRVPSSKLLAYNQYRDIWFSTNQAMRKRSIEVQTSSDPAVKVYWDTVEKPVFDGKIREAADLWRVAGFRKEVEEAYQTIDSINASDPKRAWNEWSNRLVLERDAHGDLNSAKFVPTGFAPGNFANPSTLWLSFSLNRDEIQALVASAPPGLRQRFTSAGSNTDVQSLSFEYTSVSIVRGWFAPEVFSARFWKFGRASKQLSDGALPPHGDCPGYIAAAIFVRNLSITTLATASPAPSSPGDLTIGVLRDFHDLVKNIPKPPSTNPHPSGTDHPPVSHPPLVHPPNVHLGPTGDWMPPLDEPRDLYRFDAKSIGIEATGHVANHFGPTPAAVPLNTLAPNAWTFDRKNEDFRRLVIKEAISMTPPASGPVATSTNTIYANGDVGIVAFLWTALPKSPNPDPGLHWA